MLIPVVFAFMATISFGLLFNSPHRTLVPGGVVGAVGFAVYYYMFNALGLGSQVSNFAGTVVLSVLSEIFARIIKEPVTVFSIPGIIPLVPGLPMYQGMTLIMTNAYNTGIDKLVQAGLDAAAISFGILLISSFARLLKRRKFESYRNKLYK